MKITSTIPFPADDVLLNRTVEPGETVEVTLEQAQHRLVQTANYIPADKEAEAVLAALQAAAAPPAEAAPEPVAVSIEPDVKPETQE